MADELEKASAEHPARIVRIKMEHRWRSLIARAIIASFVAWVLATVPLPIFPAHVWVAYVQVPVVIFLLICYIGKLLIDTFFYDRYRP